jgi:peptidoglycan/LPS O-acetylase OafA/YrhL
VSQVRPAQGLGKAASVPPLRPDVLGLSPKASQTLARSFSGRHNSLGFLRFLLAALVVIDHSFPISGLNGGTDPLWRWSGGQDSFGGIAVTGFFVISGFLVTRSWLSSPSTGRYIWRRFLRIFPGFWVCLLVTALLFAPLAWHHERGGLTGYFHVSVQTPIGYITRNGLLWMHQWNIGGLLGGTPYTRTGYPIAWDGSLWTLIYEFKCYLLIAVLGMAGILSRYRGMVLVLLGVFFTASLSYLVNPIWAGKMLPTFNDPFVARFGFVFLLGAACALFADRVVIDDRLGLLAAAVFLVTLREGGELLLGYPALAYLCLYLAVKLPLTGFDRHGDFSYGTYIYAFPLQQLLALHGMQRHGIWAFMGVSLLIATAAAFLSWHLVEKQAMKLKNWTPSLRRGKPGGPRATPALSDNPSPGREREPVASGPATKPSQTA